MSIRFESIEKLTELIKNKEIKPSDVVKDIYAAIEETDPTIKSGQLLFVHRTKRPAIMTPAFAITSFVEKIQLAFI